jgi:hypothetical protein
MSLFRFPALGLIGASFVVWLASSCNSDDDKCVTGESRMCVCAGADRPRGVQACTADNEFAPCDCSGQGIVEPGADDEDVFRILVGRPCRASEDCGEGLDCITAESNDFGGFGGVAGGYCTRGCNTATNAEDCTAIDPNSDCLGFDEGGNGFCFRTCQTGNPGANEAKCLDRPNLVCASEAALFGEGVQAGRNPGWCLPNCNSDAECPGRVCSPRALDGLCRDAVPQGLPIGARCEADADCTSNFCLSFDAELTERACSQQCVYQSLAFSPSACGYAADPREAGCLFPQFRSAIGSEGIGDYGLCFELCDVDSDCEQADRGWFCRLEAPIDTIAQRGGRCLPPGARELDPDAGDAGPVEAGVGGLDASSPGDGG